VAEKVSPQFKLTFITVVILTLLLLGVSIGLSLIKTPTSNITSAINTTATLYKLGFGAIFGLVGGKAV
jgi:hypothetical protein